MDQIRAYTSHCLDDCQDEDEELFVCGDIKDQYSDGIKAGVAKVLSDG